MQKKIFPWLAAIGAVLTGAALLCFPQQVKDSVRASIAYCGAVLVPSLFPFMALTGFVVRSGAGDALGFLLGPLARWGFRLPPCCAAPILMGFCGGYPAGASSTALLLEEGKITRGQAGRMMLFCVNPGPAFVVTYLGGQLEDARSGWLLFLSVTLPGLLLGALAGLGRKAPPQAAPQSTEKQAGSVLAGSVTSAAQSVVAMCACIVAFAGFTALLHGTGAYSALVHGLAATGLFPPSDAATVLSFLLEVTGGVGDAARFQASPALYAFGLGFGGLCVHLQVFAMFREFPVKKRLFFLFRLLHGLLAAGCCRILGKLLPPPAVDALPTGAPAVRALSGTAAGGLSLLLLCGAFLLAVGQGAASEMQPSPLGKGKN